jgi:hypothetical protein
VVHRVLSRSDEDIEWFGEEGERGLRGIAFDGERIFIAAGNRLLAFDRRFRPAGAWENPFLRNVKGICLHDRRLYLACSGIDCILAFDLETETFDWGMQIQSEMFRFRSARFDPRGEAQPLLIDKLGLRTVQADADGMRIAGRNTGGLLHYNGETVLMSVELPEGAQDPQRFRNGVLFNDSHAGVVRYAGSEDESEDRALAVPFFTAADHSERDPEEQRRLKRGFARGLCPLSPTVVAVGGTPAGVSLYDLRANRKLLSVQFTTEVREAVNAIAVLDRARPE